MLTLAHLLKVVQYLVCLKARLRESPTCKHHPKDRHGQRSLPFLAQQTLVMQATSQDQEELIVMVQICSHNKYLDISFYEHRGRLLISHLVLSGIFYPPPLFDQGENVYFSPSYSYEIIYGILKYMRSQPPPLPLPPNNK